WYAIPIGIIFSLSLLRQNGVSWFKSILLMLSTVLALWAMFSVGVCAVSLRLHGKYLEVQKMESSAALLRLGLLAALSLVFINAPLAVLVSTISILFQAMLMRRKSALVLDPRALRDPAYSDQLAGFVRQQFV